MKEIVIISGKGGTGKTSVTAALASLEKNQVLADCDVDAADLHLVLAPESKHAEPFIAGERAVIDADTCTACGQCAEHCRYGGIAENGDGICQVVPENCEGCGVCAFVCPVDAAAMIPRECGEWYVSGTRFGTMVHARLGIAEENSGKLVTTVRKKARDLAEEQNAELILTDGPPGIGCPVIASLGGADLALVVAEPTASAQHDLERVHGLTKHFDIPMMVIINKSGINDEVAQSIRDFCATHDVEIAGELPYDPVFTKAQINAQSVVEYDPEGRGADIRAIWDKMTDKISK